MQLITKIKFFVVLISFCVVWSAPTQVFANERTVHFDGMDAQIVSVVDYMTDKKKQGIIMRFGRINVTIHGHAILLISTAFIGEGFSLNGRHLIRVGKNKPFVLTPIGRDSLALLNPSEAELVITAMAKGEFVKFRYYAWGENERIDTGFHHPAMGFIYNKAAKLFQWKDLGVSGEINPAKLIVGSTGVSVLGNISLSLSKDSAESNGCATIVRGFGIDKGEWVSGRNNYQEEHLIIRDADGIIVFKEVFPDFSVGKYVRCPKWLAGKIAAQKAWEHAPLGSIEIEGEHGKKVMLVGFKELWQWGVDNAGFPPFE